MKHIAQDFIPIEMGVEQDPERTVHYEGLNPEFALCGDELVGDKDLGMMPGVETQEPVDCLMCLDIERHVLDTRGSE